VAEVLLALALLVVAVLALLGLSLQTMKTNQKINDTTAGQLVGEQALERIAYQAESSGTAAVWSSNSLITPYSMDQVTQGDTVFNVTVYAVDVVDSPPTFTAGHRLKQIESTVIWQNAPTGKVSQGRMNIHAMRLVHEP